MWSGGGGGGAGAVSESGRGLCMEVLSGSIFTGIAMVMFLCFDKFQSQ